jgi:hypothetical protein
MGANPPALIPQLTGDSPYDVPSRGGLITRQAAPRLLSDTGHDTAA